MNPTYTGKNGIKATVLADSISPQGVRLLTFEIEYPRLILAELNTHKMLSKASHSSRAIPFHKMVQQLTGAPVRFGGANPGMQDKGTDHNGIVLYPEYDHQGDFDYYGEYTAEGAWDSAKLEAIRWSEAFFKAGFHKQVYNRLTEPFQMMRTVITATEWGNFFWLRDHGAADPTLQELARCMREAKDASIPELLQPGEWHLPYVDTFVQDGQRHYYIWPTAEIVKAPDEAITMGDMVGLTIEDALKVSAARCAAVSFRNMDYGLVKCLEVYERLVGDERKHASAFEHQGTPMWAEGWAGGLRGAWINIPRQLDTWQAGVSHTTRDGQLWSANLRGYVQFRKLIPGENGG